MFDNCGHMALKSLFFKICESSQVYYLQELKKNMKKRKLMW